MLGGTFPGMALSDEKKNFSKRFTEALKRTGMDVNRPTSIAREFNLRFHGDPVTTQSVRKWLTGESLPSQDKVRVLAGWLNVSAQWLRFGDEEGGIRHAAKEERKTYVLENQRLLESCNRLNEHHKKMVLELVQALLRLEGKK